MTRLKKTPDRESLPHAIPSLHFERAFWRDGFQCVAGLDEVGRGALAGPVIAAVVVFPAVSDSVARRWTRSKLMHEIARANDSKLLTEATREDLYTPICEIALAFATGAASHQEIDELNILRASHLAMQRALAALPLAPHALLLDALVLPDVDLPQLGVIHGDALCLSIAAASIIAKVTRDRMMCELDIAYPGYHLTQNKGYGTPAHLAALRELGPSPIHRRSFAPVRSEISSKQFPNFVWAAVDGDPSSCETE